MRVSRNYKCKICGKEIGLKQNLNRHVKTVHEEQRNYKCELCDKSFGQKETVHEKLRDYK